MLGEALRDRLQHEEQHGGRSVVTRDMHGRHVPLLPQSVLMKAHAAVGRKDPLETLCGARERFKGNDGCLGEVLSRHQRELTAGGPDVDHTAAAQPHQDALVLNSGRNVVARKGSTVRARLKNCRELGGPLQHV